jgi:signal transduction histidine kinase
MVGTGLGLKIVKDIVLSYKGTISLVGPNENYTTCLKIEIPRFKN